MFIHSRLVVAVSHIHSPFFSFLKQMQASQKKGGMLSMFSFSKKKKTTEELTTDSESASTPDASALLAPALPEHTNNRASRVAHSKAGSLSRPPMDTSAFAYGGNSGEDQKYEVPEELKEEEPPSPGMPEFRRSFGTITDGYTLTFEIAIEEQSMEEFGLNEQEAFCMAVAHCLGLTKAQVGVETARAGSVVATMKVAGLPDADAASAVAAKIANGLTDQLEGFGLGPCAIVSKISGDAPQQQSGNSASQQQALSPEPLTQSPIQVASPALAAPSLPPETVLEIPTSREQPLPSPPPNPTRESSPLQPERSSAAIAHSQASYLCNNEATHDGYHTQSSTSPGRIPIEASTESAGLPPQMHHSQYLQPPQQLSPTHRPVEVPARGRTPVPVVAVATAETGVQTETSNDDSNAVATAQRDAKWQAWWETLPVDAQFEEV